MFRAFLVSLALAFTGATHGIAETRVPQSQAEIALSFTPLVKETAPAVVNIYARRVVERRQSPFMGDPFFQNLFRDFGQQRPEVQNSLGSGVILSEDGIVVSNYHVVGMATDIRVHLNDRREFSASVLLADEASDLAVLQLKDADGMPFLSIRDSDTVEVGELALAIGNPFGVGQTVTSGIVSGLARSGTATGQAFGYFLQTDAAINPGNSGGALVDLNGALIGINTSILTRSGGSNGIGFAIPSSLVARVVEQARAGNERFVRPWAGMTGQPVDWDMAEAFGLDLPTGVVITELHTESPFGRAGLTVGDVILAVDGLSVNTPAEMLFRMSVAGLGAQSEFLVLARGERRAVSVVMLSAPEVPARDTRTLGDDSALPGLVLSNLNPAVQIQYGIPYEATGVAVEDPGNAGSRLGLRQGDVILGVNQSQTETADAAEAILTDVRGNVAVLVQRANQRIALRFRR